MVFPGGGTDVTSLTMERGFNSIAKHVLGLACSVLLGLLGGAICGSLILSLCALSGRIQTTGENHIGYWHYTLFVIGSIYGGPLGAMLGPIAYATIIRTIGFKRAAIAGTMGTIIGGYAGAVISPVLGVPTGIGGFFVAGAIARFRNSVPRIKAVA